MLTHATLERILTAIPRLTIGVLGDLFLDRYLDIDASLTEQSLETGLDAYQVVRVRPSPGAAGTIINNLVALGVKRVAAFSVIGDDGEGYELLWALKNYGVVDGRAIYSAPEWRTPTYTKPMLKAAGERPRELNRLDIKNYEPLRSNTEGLVLCGLDKAWPDLDALLVLDQVGRRSAGVITDQVAARLSELGRSDPDKLILADSRERIETFQSLSLKPNSAECQIAARKVGCTDETTPACAMYLARRNDRPVFCTDGERGTWVAYPLAEPELPVLVPAYTVTGPVDIVGAGDSSAAGIACAVAAGATCVEAAAFGNLVASITIQQIGTTGTATPKRIRMRWTEVASR